MIERGSRAPEFTLPDHDGNPVSLRDLGGQRVVLAFYPLDFSPVCTDQLGVYQQVLAELERRGARLFGVSVDSAFCHRAFRDRLGLTIPLLADFNPKGEVARRFGLYQDDQGVAQRALVMIGPDGVVEWTHRSASPLEIPSAELLLEALGDRESR